VPLDERAQQVHPVGRLEFALHLGPKARLIATVHEQCARGKRNVGTRRRLRRGRQCCAFKYLDQLLSGFVHQVVGANHVRRHCQHRESDGVRRGDLSFDERRLVAAHGSQGAACELGQVAGENLVCFGGVKPFPCHEAWVELANLVVERGGDCLLVERSRKPLHTANLRNRDHSARDGSPSPGRSSAKAPLRKRRQALIVRLVCLSLPR